MKNVSIKNIAVSLVFCLFVFGFFFAALFHKPVKYSESERKELAQFPEITWKSVLDKSAIQGFDKYSAEQFPLREEFLSIYRWYRVNVVNPQVVQSVIQKGPTVNIVNGYAEADGYVAQINTSLSAENVNSITDKFNRVYDKYLKDGGGKVYYSVIPMKDYFFNEEHNTPVMSYNALLSLLDEKLEGFEYIDIIPLLSLEDYYKTDTHWSQDKILAVRDKLLSVIGGADKLDSGYEANSHTGFEGAYFAYAPVKVAPDTIYYLSNDTIDGLVVKSFEFDNSGKLVESDISVYNESAIESKEPYDFFLHGVRPFVRIDNPNATTDKEIIVFRDSFGASIAPLIAEGYSRVYLIDLRKITIDMLAMLGEELQFEGRDVLFLYSAELLNALPNMNSHPFEK